MLGYESASSSYLHISTGSPALEVIHSTHIGQGLRDMIGAGHAMTGIVCAIYGALDHRGWDLMNKQRSLMRTVEHVTIANHHPSPSQRIPLEWIRNR